MTAPTTSRYWWHRYTSTESFQRILNGEDAWIAIGDFLDEWKREEREDRVALIANPLPSPMPSPLPPDIHLWRRPHPGSCLAKI